MYKTRCRREIPRRGNFAFKKFNYIKSNVKVRIWRDLFGKGETELKKRALV